MCPNMLVKTILKFNILFQDPNTPRLKRDISNNN